MAAEGFADESLQAVAVDCPTRGAPADDEAQAGRGLTVPLPDDPEGGALQPAPGEHPLEGCRTTQAGLPRVPLILARWASADQTVRR